MMPKINRPMIALTAAAAIAALLSLQPVPDASAFSDVALELFIVPRPSDSPETAEFKRMASGHARDLAAREDAQKPPFNPFTIDQTPEYPYYITAADTDGDGRDELIVSKIASSHEPNGYGAIDVYRPLKAGDVSSWTSKRVFSEVKFPNKVLAADVDGDRRRELIVPFGSIVHDAQYGGGIVWIESSPAALAGPPGNNAPGGPGAPPHPPNDGHDGPIGHVKTHVITKASNLMYRAVALGDINGDRIADIVAVAEIRGAFGDGESLVQVFYGNKTDDRFDKRPVTIGEGLGGFPTIMDIDGDGDPDVAAAEFYGAKGSFAWYENLGQNKWLKRYIDDGAGKAFQLTFVPGLYNDNKIYAVGSNHTNNLDDSFDRESAVFVYEKPLNPRFSWTRTQISSGIRPRKSEGAAIKQKAPGAFAYGDVNNDRYTDIVVNGSGDPNVYLLSQTRPGKFQTAVLSAEMPHGGVAVTDLDGDGVAEIALSSAENDRLLVYKYQKPKSRE